MRIYVTSSWRNDRQQEIVSLLRAMGHEVYDFRNAETAFSWEEIEPAWRAWSASQFREALKHPLAKRGSDSDMDALKNCDLCILVLPCGRSAHFELGYARGLGKQTIVLLDNDYEAELVYIEASAICVSKDDLVAEINRPLQGMLDAMARWPSCSKPD
jgi:nucleoside 2-deoxyribosyltransferase